MRSKQSGFTLVEIAIVLVIIGLLLGGVLKGQELINSAKVKNMINDFRSTSTFVYAYQDRFKALPGDDREADSHVGAGSVASTFPGGALGNGRINGVWNPNNAAQTDETYVFWRQVRLAGLASGNPTLGGNGYVYTNADGGPVGVTGNAVGPNWAASFYVCSAGIQGRYARQIDTTIDDGDTTLGTVRVLGLGILDTTGNNGADPFVAVGAANDADLYTVCVAY